MKTYHISKRNDLNLKINNKWNIYNQNIKLLNYKHNNYKYKIIYYKKIEHLEIKKILKKIIKDFIDDLNLKKQYHALIVGMGNDNHISDSIGPRTLKYITANSFYSKLGINTNNNIISSLEPGSLGETGIEAKRIIEAVKNTIKPDLLIIIDSYIVNNINFLNKSIQVTNEGLLPHNSLEELDDEINSSILNVPIIVIGVPTALEIEEYKNKEVITPYLLCSKNIDTYIEEIAKIIGESINEVIIND